MVSRFIRVISFNMYFIVVVIQLVSHARLFVTPWSPALQEPFTISQNLLKLRSIESVMPSNHLIFCGPLLLLPSG